MSGIVACFLELLLGFQTDDGLVQQHMVEHRTQCIVGILARSGFFHGLGDGHAQRAGIVRVFRQHIAAGLRLHARAGEHLPAPGLHHGTAERFLVVAHAHHEDAHFQAEHLSGKRDRRTPLSRTGLGGETFDTGLLVVIGLRNGGVHLVRTGRRDAFVFVVDLGRACPAWLPAGARGTAARDGTCARLRAPVRGWVSSVLPRLPARSGPSERSASALPARWVVRPDPAAGSAGWAYRRQRCTSAWGYQTRPAESWFAACFLLTLFSY